MKLLAFETATEACSVALYLDGQVLERHEIAPRRHAELSLPWADALLAEAGVARAQLDAIAVSRGPGAFTGVRLAIALSQGVALALDRPLIGVSTLEVLACRAPRAATHVLAAIDARMGEVYAAAFERLGEGWRALDPERVCAPQNLVPPALAGAEWHGVGTGFSAQENALARQLGWSGARIDAAALPHAGDLATLAATAWEQGARPAPETIEPAYLRNNVALTLVEQQAARAAKGG
jgi:tRNA threonylcarbamoyladenosine biosynthesis protein TsaB